MVELRKRKEPPTSAATTAPKKKSENNAKPLVKTDAKPKSGPPLAGDTISLDGFGGELQLHDGDKSTLKGLIGKSDSGVVLFMYPKADTPGCTKQACLFRDSHSGLTASGFTIYGLSADTPAANAKFKNKYNLPYNLISGKELIEALGYKKPNSSSTLRGVVIIDKDGKVLASKAGSPAGTLEIVEPIVQASEKGGSKKTVGGAGEWDLKPTKADTPVAEVAAQVADTAKSLDAGKL